MFVIVLENESYSSTFGDPSAFPYLARTLVKLGALLRNYYATGHDSNDNYISLVSGQPPNTSNQADCVTFENFTNNSLLSNGVESGNGCVYPANVKNIGNQLSRQAPELEGLHAGHGQRPQPATRLYAATPRSTAPTTHRPPCRATVTPRAMTRWSTSTR